VHIVSHVDDVLTRAIVVPAGESLFKEKQEDEGISPEMIPQEEGALDPLQIN